MPSRKWACRAFTSVEMLIASAIFLLMVAALLVGNSFGMRIMQLCQPKLLAAGEIRKAVNLLHSEIGAAKAIDVGRGDFRTFTPAEYGSPRQGNALQIYPAQETNYFIRYYLDAEDQSLKRITNGAPAATIVARAISNEVVFTAEDCAGNVLTNKQDRLAVHVRLQFMRMAGSSAPIGPVNYYKSHRVETRTGPRER